MLLYHNADLTDINDIVKNGLLPSSITGNNNWNDGRRADNSADVVYLFHPTGVQNSFVNYGIVLIEVDVDAEKSEMTSNDSNIGKYEEYTISEVKPEQITRIFIPKIFKDRIHNLSDEVLEKIIWCDIKADVYAGYMPNPNDKYGFGGTYKYEPISEDKLKLFAQTAPIYVNSINYFRGVDGTKVFDIYNVIYLMN